jgi:hypothetical protein
MQGMALNRILLILPLNQKCSYMNPCYILTYEIGGECAVNVNNVERIEDESNGGNPKARCRLYFKDGKVVILDEGCEAYNNKAPLCSMDRPTEIKVYD